MSVQQNVSTYETFYFVGGEAKLQMKAQFFMGPTSDSGCFLQARARARKLGVALHLQHKTTATSTQAFEQNKSSKRVFSK